MALITLISSDHELFNVEESVMKGSVTIKSIIEDTGNECHIPLPNVSAKVLAKIIEYCKYHAKAGSDAEAQRNDDVKAWDDAFIDVDQSMLFDIILGANYLNIKSLLDLGCAKVAGMIKGKTPEEIRRTFNIKNDFTPEEEEQVRQENQWAFD